MVGRGSRIYEGKEYCEFIDISNCLINYGLPEEFKGFKDEIEFKQFKQKQTLVESKFSIEMNQGEELIDVSSDALIKFTNELKEIKNKSYRHMSVDELRKAFLTTNSIRELVHIANEVNRRKNGFMYRDTTTEKIIEQMEKYYNLLSSFNKEKSTMKAYKTRIRNILNKGKKLSSMIYFPEWYYNEVIKKYGFLY
jgi:hypothetical protein